MDQDTLYCVDYFSGIYSVDIQFDEPLVLNKILDISNIETLFVSQGYIFIATRYQGISIIDRQTLETLWSIKTPGNIHQIYSTEHIIYALDGIAGLQVILFNSVQSPQIIASVNTKDRATKCALYDQFAYIADRSGAFNIVDLHHMYSKKSIYSIPSTDIIYDIVYFENQLFVADGKAGIKIFSPLSDPQWMNKMIHIDTPGTANGIYVDSNFIMVADGDQGVQIIQKNGTHYDFSGTIDTTGYAKDIVRYSSYAFVANMTDQVKLIHMAYPSNPSIVSSIPCKGMSMHLCLSQHTLVVSEGDMGIEIFDIENPSHAKCLQWINTPGFAFQTALIDNSLIVADGSAGIHIYQKQDQIFIFIESIESHDTAQKIVVDDHDIYVIDSGGRIMVFELCPDDSIQLKNHISVRASVHHIVKHDDLLFLADAYGLSALPMPYEIQGISIQDKSHASFQLPKIKYQGIYSVNIIKHGNVMPVDGYIQITPQLDKPSPGLAIIVGGGEFSRNNRFAETTLKLTTQMYQDLITLGFDDDSIHWMINSNMVDIDYDGQCDKVVDHTYPTVQEFLNVLDHAKMNALDRNNPLFIYLQGAATQKGLFDIQDKQDHLKPDDLNCKLDKIQAQTDCLIIMLMEFSYAGAFIETLSKHDRIIITSVDADSYDLIDNINDAFSRILLANIVNNGESLTKAFIRAKNDKINHLWPGCPLMDDNGDGIANAFDGFFADQVFNLVVETHDLSMMEIIVMGLQSLCGLERDRLRAVGLEGVIGLMRILSGKL